MSSRGDQLVIFTDICHFPDRTMNKNSNIGQQVLPTITLYQCHLLKFLSKRCKVKLYNLKLAPYVVDLMQEFDEMIAELEGMQFSNHKYSISWYYMV